MPCKAMALKPSKCRQMLIFQFNNCNSSNSSKVSAANGGISSSFTGTFFVNIES